MAHETTDRLARAERLSDAVVHLVGVTLALGAVPVLIGLSILRRGEAQIVMAVTVYGTTLLAMLICSAIYHLSGDHRFSLVLKRMDHSAIFLKIAGTFTPLVALTGGGSGMFLGAVWAVALGGSSLKIVAPNNLRWLGLSLYVGLGWAGVLFGQDILAGLTPGAMQAVAVGGALYTMGLVFFLWEKLPFHTAIWHAFVLTATASLFTAMCLEITRVVEPAFPVG